MSVRGNGDGFAHLLAVVKADDGNAGMNPAIFRPLQARGQVGSEQTTAVGQSTQIDLPVHGRQEKRHIDDVALYNKRVQDAYAAVAKLATLEPDDAQLAKAFIPPMKRQASKVTVTTTTTVANVETVTATATATATANAMAAAAQATQSSTESDAMKATASSEASKPSANAAAAMTSADASSSPTNADTAASQTGAAAQGAQAQASPGADANSSTNSSDQAAATMNANANSNSTESSSSSTSTSVAGATAAASNGRTTFDNSQGVEVQAGAIQGAQASSATQTDLLPGDKGTDFASSASSSQQPVPDAADGGPLPQPTGPPNNGIGSDAANTSPQPAASDAADAQTSEAYRDPAGGQPSTPAPDATPPQGSDAATPVDPPSPPDNVAAPEDDEEEELARRSDGQSRDFEHQYRGRNRVLHDRLIRRSGSLLYLSLRPR
ncbi:hypothetical protein E6O75_ATG04117 [Venturia nashicola]|uniref:Uncharacterized protein n=1 Tax=Venturia nashicola TaxID=86259 RepID=A0A4Z1PPV4_9PEZI|nr:hypothetical protein E6O75_ATG04117 [Venturia nashicola]